MSDSGKGEHTIMYQAICPDCGATITLNVPGDLYAGCPECQFYGWVPSTTAAAVTRPLAPIPAQVTPLTDEQMGAIRAILAVTDRGDTRFHATQALLAEVERLRAREAAREALVSAVDFVLSVEAADRHGEEPDSSWWENAYKELRQARALLVASGSEASE